MNISSYIVNILSFIVMKVFIIFENESFHIVLSG